MQIMQEALKLFPPSVRDKLAKMPEIRSDAVEEVRCRNGQPYVVAVCNAEIPVSETNVCPAHLDYILEKAADYSFHTRVKEFKAGFLHTGFGCRVGVCGTVTDGGLESVTSLSIRIPHEVRMCAQPVISELTKDGFSSTLIIAPPGAGKTTLLRDLIRTLSAIGYRVSVADDRGEIAAVFRRLPQFDLGPRTDIMSGGKKAESCMKLLRAMNPQILALDEITAPEDLSAILCAAGCGVALLSTAHAVSSEHLSDRPIYRQLLKERIFLRAIEINLVGDKRTYKVVNL